MGQEEIPTAEQETEFDESVDSDYDRNVLVSTVLSPRQRKLAELAASGVSNVKIADQLGYSQSRVSILLRDATVRAEVDRIKERIYEDSIGRRLKDLARPALEALEQCLHDKKNIYKKSEILDIAKWTVEKLDGKAVQKHDVGENMLSLMMDRLDALKASGQTSLDAIDVTKSDQKQIEEGEFTEVQTPEVSKSEEDLVNDWFTGFQSVKNP